MRTHHASQCGWNFDQRDDECDCGFKRPATIGWAETELSAAKDRLENAEKDVAFCEARLAEMRRVPLSTDDKDYGNG